MRAQRPTLGDGLSAAEVSGRSRIDLLFYNRNDLSMDRLDVLIRFDNGRPAWATWKLREESVTDFLEVFDPPFFESVLAPLDSRGCDRRIDVEHDRHVGQAPCRGDLTDLPERFDIEPTGGTLVDDVGKQKSIANDRPTRIERWPDVLGDELGSSGHVQEHLGGVGKRDVFAMQEDLTNRRAELGRSGISVGLDFVALRGKPLGKQFDLGGLASTVDAVEGDEHRHYIANDSMSSFGAIWYPWGSMEHPARPWLSDRMALE